MHLTTGSSEKRKAHFEPEGESFILTQCEAITTQWSHAPRTCLSWQRPAFKCNNLITLVRHQVMLMTEKIHLNKPLALFFCCNFSHSWNKNTCVRSCSSVRVL